MHPFGLDELVPGCSKGLGSGLVLAFSAFLL